ncbi:phosphate signaling complex protein PhoU [Sphingomicrobium astaxanthinifaciens]|uniref:phosphate signaling complex protein PhoU n=1 Tax=Sphingomicrobium astaxanthinifaciens TaxID=1227949 RepID=UPI001FCCB03E|nr:phosphate signaling complex protein PhoU [Sphingomicrobium astaxanthinifaciens]MCJ7421017.1 phosphate signaling complex protein PhoU [Sphingomicrobium astaxanthinifaciens]
MKHSVAAFDDDLKTLRDLVAQMGSMARTALDGAIHALGKNDRALAEKVIAGDAEIDAIETRIDQFAIRTIALRAPMADDLRDIISALKIANVLERVADYAKNIARRSRKVTDADADPLKQRLAELAALSGDLIDKAVKAYATRDPDLATAVCEGDDAVDTLYASIFKDTVGYMRGHADEVDWAAHGLFIAKHLERMGDQATNIAEIVYYMETGELLPDRPKQDETAAD